MTRILVVDDQEIIRDAMARLVGTFPGHRVVGAAGSLREAGPLIEKLRPELILSDLLLQDGHGTELVRMVRQAKLKARVLIMTRLRDAFAASEAMKAGIAGYILKAQPTADLVAAIAAVGAGQRYLSPYVALPPSTASPATPAISDLSRRENEIFRLVIEGLSSKEIGRRLCISVKTVETHRSNIHRKLAVSSASDLIRFAISQGIAVAPSAPRSFAAF